MNIDVLLNMSPEEKRKRVSRMSRKQKEELNEQLLERERRAKQRKILTFYPETGPLRRELYIPHMKFFQAGVQFRERGLISANRIGKCLTYRTLIDTSKGQIPIGELFESQENFIVSMKSGASGLMLSVMAGPVFKKPKKEECVRLTMADGQGIGCALDHRILTNRGWQFVADVLPYLPSKLEGFFPNPRGSSSDTSPSIQRPDADHWKKRVLSFLDHCFPGFHQHGEPLLSGQGSAQWTSPSRAGVLRRIVASCNLDDQGHRCTNTLPLTYGLPSTQDEVFRALDQYLEFSGRVLDMPYRLYLDLRQKFQQFFSAEASRPQPSASTDQHQKQFSSYLAPFYMNTSNKIVSCESIGRQDVYDFEVPIYHNYLASGLIHHNTEGVGGYEMTHHLTGQYPDWWKEEDGYKKFNIPIRAWAAGDTNETTKDILQAKLCGPITDIGSGLIPGESIVDWKRKAGSVPDTIESVYVQHQTNGVKDGISVLKFKSYEQGRKSFQGTEQHVILLDEEPPANIRHECLMRTMATGGFEGGIIMLTFTPLLGMSEVVLEFMPDGKMPEDFEKTGKFLVGATWDDAPHLSKEEKEALWAALPPHQRDARSRGIPQLGSGAIYPISEEDLLEDDFPIPDHWPRAYGFDHGWNATAALWGAWDMEPDKPILHLYSEYKRGQAEPEVHASNIKTRGDWICGVSDPSKGTSSRDGEQLLMTYKTLLPGLQEADNAVEAGLFDTYMLMTQGRLKVFRSLPMWLGEFRMYRRDENGKVVKENDHLMDDMRYLVRSGRKVAKIMPIKMFAERNISKDDYDPLNFGLGVG